MNGNYPPGVTGAESYFYLPDDPPATCYECSAVLADVETGRPGAASCPESPGLCQSCHGCDETCVAFVRCTVCHALTRNYTVDYPTGPRCVEYFACARRKDGRDAVLRQRTAAIGRQLWRCTTHARDNAAETAGEYPTGACWGALRDPRAGAALGCVYVRMEPKP